MIVVSLSHGLFFFTLVIVPPGVSPGQTIEVRAPDGSGRSVMATVPQGMTPGSSFMVEFPPIDMSSPGPSVVASSVASSAPPQYTDRVDYSTVTVMPPPAPVEPFVQAVPVGAAPGATTISAAPDAASLYSASPMPVPFGQPMLRVQVPPGTPPGTTIHVQVPGENRTILAQVPPGGVSSFHVPYQAQSPATPAVPASSTGDKLLLVRVPPGVSPGDTLHVNIPDEPGRVIAATVPPGNVSEFHVSYQPRNQPSGFQPRNSNGFQPSNGPRNGYQTNNGNQSRGSGMEGMILPLVGAAALGIAGASMYEHYHNNNDYSDGNAYADTGGDYGGGDDWGGSDDYGGDYGGDMDFGDF